LSACKTWGTVDGTFTLNTTVCLSQQLPSPKHLKSVMSSRVPKCVCSLSIGALQKVVRTQQLLYKTENRLILVFLQLRDADTHIHRYPPSAQRPRIRMRGKPVVFIVGRGGGGHKAAARALQSSLGWADIETMDAGYTIEAILTKQPPRNTGFDMDELYNVLMRHGFSWTASMLGLLARAFAVVARGSIVRGLAERWRVQQPEVVVSFVPFFNGVFREALLEAAPHAACITVVTDFESSAEHLWIDPYDAATAERHTIVAGTPALQRQCIEVEAYPHANVLATSGMLLHPDFYAPAETGVVCSGCDQEPISSSARRALVCFGAFPPMRVEEIVNALIAIGPQKLEIVALCGGNEVLLQRLRARGDCVAEPMLPAHRVGELMRWASFVVGKPGPGVVSETIASGTCFVTERQGVMAQERCVLQWMEESGVGVVVDSLCEPPADLCERVSACLPAVAAARDANRAVFEVADLVRSLRTTPPISDNERSSMEATSATSAPEDEDTMPTNEGVWRSTAAVDDLLLTALAGAPAKKVAVSQSTQGDETDTEVQIDDVPTGTACIYVDEKAKELPQLM
jgi:hypothetical protein